MRISGYAIIGLDIEEYISHAMMYQDVPNNPRLEVTESSAMITLRYD
jgi:hypothetical protein